MRSAIVVALALCLLTVGCVTSSVTDEVDREYKARYGPVQRFGLWFVDRLDDMSEVFQANVSFGFGLVANVHVTEVAQLGIGWFDGQKFGWQQRGFGFWNEQREEYGFGPMYHIEVKRQAVGSTVWPLPPFVFYPDGLFRHDYDYTGLDIPENPTWKEDDHHWSDLGASLNLLLVGGELNLGVAEFVDALLGLNPVGLIMVIFDYYEMPWDIMRDDTWQRVRMDLEATRSLEGGE